MFGVLSLLLFFSPSLELTHLPHAIAVAIEAGGRAVEMGDGAVSGEGYGGVLFG